MSKVKTYILNAHNDTLTRKSWHTLKTLTDITDSKQDGSGINTYLAGMTSLDTLYFTSLG